MSDLTPDAFKENGNVAVTSRVSSLVMISMRGLKISSFLERTPLPQPQVGPARQRLAAAEAPVGAPVDARAPNEERRVTANRRSMERREAEQPTFLDTRIAQGRRRNPGRRADDQRLPSLRIAISVQA